LLPTPKPTKIKAKFKHFFTDPKHLKTNMKANISNPQSQNGADTANCEKSLNRSLNGLGPKVFLLELYLVDGYQR
jgi:hypothetical protein